MAQQILGGRYLLKDKVGSGGMATVYRALDQVLNRTVAVKIMLPQYAADATFAARFKQEAQAAAGLSSPYIVGVYDWGKDGDTYYIVMEYLRGTDLKSGIRSHGALDPKKVAQIGSQICAALSVAHKHEIIHRDIKPQNIMVLPDGNIKVMDFGIARAKNSHLTQDNNVLGTAHYVSPEQTRGHELGPTSDIYSLGVVMYECATGRVPFDGDDAISVAMKQVQELPVPPSQVNPGVDGDLERIILKCMEKDPANRFQTADELRQVLNNYLAGRAIDVGEPTRIITPGMIPGGTETQALSDQTRAMVRPQGDAGRTSIRGGAANGTDPYHTDEKSGKKGKGKVVAIVIAAIAVIAIAAAAAVALLGGNGEMVTVPNVIGYEQEDAVKELEDAGLEVSVSRSYDDKVDEGKVLDQLPGGGQTVAKGTTIDITVSRGAQPVKEVQVPNLSGKTEDEANAALAEVGLKGEATTEANDAAEGTVFEQSPAAGATASEGDTVTFKVSTGPNTVVVPDVRGYPESTAKQMLSDAGLSYTTTQSYSDSIESGYVVSYNPGGNVEPGTQISLVISMGSEPEQEPVDNTSGNGNGSSSSFDVTTVTGMLQSQATKKLQQNGFSVDVKTQSSDKPEGTVLEVQDNGDGSVTLVVAGS